MSIKLLLFWGGGYFGFGGGGGSADFIFMGARIFLKFRRKIRETSFQVSRLFCGDLVQQKGAAKKIGSQTAIVAICLGLRLICMKCQTHTENPPILAFFDFLAFFVFRFSLLFCAFFLPFSRDFRGSAKRKTLAFLGKNPCFFQKSKDWRVRAEKRRGA